MYLADSVYFSSGLLDSEKDFTWEVLNLTQAQRELFLDEILMWDGSKSEDFLANIS